MAPTLPIPQTSAELHEMLTDAATMHRLMNDPVALADFLEKSVQARLSTDPGIKDQVKEQTEAFLSDWLRTTNKGELNRAANKYNLTDPNAMNRITPRRSVYNRSAVGAKHDGMFDSLPDMLAQVSHHTFRTAALSDKLEQLRNAAGTVRPSEGGFLVSEEYRAELLRVAMDTAIVRSRARVVPMDSQTLAFPAVDITSHASSIYGGIIGYWLDEGATLTASAPKFCRVQLTANKLCLYIEVPNELITDSRPAFQMFMDEVFPEACGWFEDIAFFIGGGVGEPLGFLNAPCAISLSRTGSGQNIDWADVAGMYSRCLPQSLNRAVWVVSPDAAGNLLTMPFTVGGTSPIMLGGGMYPTGQTGAPMAILGRPVLITELARAAGTSGDIALVDFGYYLLGDRQAMTVAESVDFKFDTDATAFRVIERLDGQPWLKSDITPQNGSANTLSPIVKLA